MLLAYKSAIFTWAPSVNRSLRKGSGRGMFWSGSRVKFEEVGWIGLGWTGCECCVGTIVILEMEEG